LVSSKGYVLGTRAVNRTKAGVCGKRFMEKRGEIRIEPRLVELEKGRLRENSPRESRGRGDFL